MQPSPYSWILNQIRLGAEQLNLWVAARIRFPEVPAMALYQYYSMAWAGVAVAKSMEFEPEIPFEHWLNMTPINKVVPGVYYSMDIWSQQLGGHEVSSWDMKIIAKVTMGGFTDYSSFRYEVGPGMNYRMVKQVAGGILVKEYLRGAEGDVELHAEYIVGIW